VPRRPPLRLLVLPATALLLAGCTAGPVEVPPGPVEGSAVDAACRALVDTLPHEVDPGVERRDVEPASGRTAAWGDPAVTLECGVEPPERSEPPFVVNGVEFTTRDVGAATRWTTYGRTVFAAFTVPDEYGGADVMLAVAAPVDRALPDDPAVAPVTEEPPP
jgi:hypothetical protein